MQTPLPIPRPWIQVRLSPSEGHIYHPSPILWKTDPLPQASGVPMDLPTQSWPSGLGVDIQSLLDQSEIFPRIFQIGDKEKQQKTSLIKLENVSWKLFRAMTPTLLGKALLTV